MLILLVSISEPVTCIQHDYNGLVQLKQLVERKEIMICSGKNRNFMLYELPCYLYFF